MKNMALSVLKIKQSMAIRRQQAGLWAALVVLLASSLAPAQTSSVSQQSRQPSPTKEAASTGGAAAAAPSTGFVDGTSSCSFRTGNRDCVIIYPPYVGVGPFRKVGEGIRGVSPGGTLNIRAGSYTEPILLNKPMEIRAYDGTVTIVSPSPLAEFDLVADTVDDNGLPLNPKWGAQRNNPSTLPEPGHCPATRDIKGDHDPGSFPCTNQFTYLNGGRICGSHVNWFGVTYTGVIQWDERSCQLHNGVPGDDDYNMRLTRDDKAGYVVSKDDSGNQRDFILCEFGAAETINSFNSPWWSRFRGVVEGEECESTGPRAQGALDGSFAIVTALMGFDPEHANISVELHPVWAMAINVRPSDINVLPSVNDELWAFFVRNWGNEGFCSSNQEFIDFPNNQYTFRLPWKPGATSVSVTNESWHAYHLSLPPPIRIGVRPVPGVGVFVTFPLDAPRDDGSMWDGELHLTWK